MELFPVYKQWDIEPVKGLGTTLWTADGEEYTDLYGGHAVISVGHCHPHYVAALNKQAQTLGFYSNAVKNSLQSTLAAKLGEASGYPDWDEYYNGNGTSFSTPVLAGAVACLRQARPYASVQVICDAIRACSDRATTPDNYYGYGIPDLSLALELLSVEEPTGDTPAHIISVFPNPSQGEVHVTLNVEHKADLTVYDITGRQIFSYHFNGLNHTTLENHLNNLESGVYFINAVSEAGSETLKLVISK